MWHYSHLLCVPKKKDIPRRGQAWSKCVCARSKEHVRGEGGGVGRWQELLGTLQIKCPKESKRSTSTVSSAEMPFTNRHNSLLRENAVLKRRGLQAVSKSVPNWDPPVSRPLWVSWGGQWAETNLLDRDLRSGPNKWTVWAHILGEGRLSLWIRNNYTTEEPKKKRFILLIYPVRDFVPPN